IPSSLVRSRSTRRTATVTTSAPDASIAAIICSFDAYFPVPTIRRERNSRPPINSGESWTGRLIVAISAPAHEMHDLEDVAVAAHASAKRLAVAEDLPVVLDDHHPRGQRQRGQETAERRPPRQLTPLAID